MKPRRLIWASSALCLLIASCDKNKSTSAAAPSGNEKSDSLAADRAALEDERMELERHKLEEERAALDEEKAALEAEREARLADREQDADQRDLTLEERQRALADREIDLRDREGELADREAGLSDRELERAGQDSLDDWEPEPVADYQEPVADYGTFYEDLQPYGSWVETPTYGYVYQPTICVQDTSWRPYTRGRWACTNRGWAWVSDEPFGWACFHYGRWTLINGRGWVWVPGDEWAPSWVCWREGGDCVGWAPLPPETLCYRGHGWGKDVEGDFGIGHGCFTFVHCKNMADPIWRHCLPINQNGILINQTTNITNIHVDHDRVVSGGPRFEKLRQLIGRPWPLYQLDTDRFQGLRDLAHRNAELRGNRLTVFAPSMNTRWNAELKPQRVTAKWDNVKVERAESGIKPEWTDRFREAREKQKEQAVAWKRDNAGSEDMKKQLQANREKVMEAQKTYQAKQQELIEARREKLTEKLTEKREQQQASKEKTLPGMANRQPAKPDKTTQEAPTGTDKPTLAERQRELAERVRGNRGQQGQGEGVAQAEAPRATPDRTARPDNTPLPEGMTRNGRDRQPQLQKQEQPLQRGQGNDGAVAQDNNRRQQLEDARAQQQEQVRQRQEENRQRQEEARQNQEKSRTDAEEGTRRQQMEEARRQQQEAAREKADQARQQQDERQRQMEENRQRQQEQARDQQEQARRQAEENGRRQQQEQMQRQQQEQARQQQEERARAQQEERARQQEQARQQQEERAREQQERARQQEEQRARQQEEMQRRQEEARQRQEENARQQEQARQQQEQARQQQEQARQQQQEESRRQQEESRRQQEESRRQDDERNRKQQEESQRQRGGR
ncbi:DUF6600 domain-containing protein [Luteolibacter soli]|uniref:DUF6600 domain-containing protein n=1 Tax=Luteolibacter soli TaxID=3135280 RepID=A0ABU9AQT7_9BACT